MIYIELRRFNELVVRLVGQIENFAMDVNAVNKPAKGDEISDLERRLQFAELENNPGSQITLYAETFRGTEQFIGGIH